MTIECDILVIGAGPIGSAFSYIASKEGNNVLMVDRKNEVASPLRGGEAVSKFLFEKLEQELSLDGVYRWPIHDTLIYTPTAIVRTCEIKWKSFILDREEVEKKLVKNALDAGSRLMLGVTVNNFCSDGDGIIKKVEAKSIFGKIEIKPKIVVGADGATSTLRRWLLGRKIYSGIKDWGCAIEFDAINVDLDYENTMQLFMGEVTGGYSYIFPKGENRADIGTGTRPFYGKDPLSEPSPIDFFYKTLRGNKFMNRQVKNFCPIKIKGGIIDLSRPIHPVFKNAILVGDSANQNFAYVGEGIIPGWQAAIIAAKTVDKSLSEEDLSVLEEYPRTYEKTFIGQEAKRTVKIKDNISKVIDMDIDPKIKSILTVMLETEIIEWNGKELETALKYKDCKELIKYANDLIEEKELDMEINPL